MSVYVDPLFVMEGRNARQKDARLPHYDLVPPRREEAVKLGAIEFSLADWFKGKRPAFAEATARQACPEQMEVALE